MPRPQGMRRDDYSRGTLQVAALVFLFLIVFVVSLIGAAYMARAETVNRASKQDHEIGKSYHRVCELTEADNIEILNRRSPDAKIVRYEGGQAKLYRYILQTGNRINGSNTKVQWVLAGPFKKRHGGYSVQLPVPDRLYIVRQKGRSTVFPFFVTDGCVARLLFQFPYNLHLAILKEMRVKPA